MRGAEALDSVLPLVTIAQLDLDAAQGFLVAVDREQHRIRHGGENTAAVASERSLTSVVDCGNGAL